MRTITVELFDDGLRLSNDTLGRAGEKNVVQFIINFDALRNIGLGLTTATLLYKPRNSPVLAMPSVEIPEGDLETLVPDWAMSVFGVTQVQLQLTGEGVETRSYIWNMRVERSLINYGDKPTPLQDWLEEVRDVIDDAAALTGLKILDFYPSFEDLAANVTDPSPGDAYATGDIPPYDVYVYGETSGWVNVGPMNAGGGTGTGGGGVIFIPSVSPVGTLSWENNGDLPNPDPVNLMGPRGAKGDSGDVGPQGPEGLATVPRMSALMDWDTGKSIGYKLEWALTTRPTAPSGVTILHGTSPKVAVEETDDGHRVTITDADGAHSFEVLNGESADEERFTEIEQDATNTAERVTNLEQDMAEVKKITDNFELFVPKFANTAEGEMLVLTDSAEGALQGLKVYGRTTQDGTPSPDAPVPLVSVGDDGAVVVTVEGDGSTQTLAISTPSGLPSEGDVCDEIDLERGVYVQRVQKMQLTSAMSWHAAMNGKRIYTEIKTLQKEIGSPILCTHAVKGEWASDAEGTICLGNKNVGAVGFSTADFATVDEVKAFLDANAVYIVAPLLTPIETPLSDEEIAAYKALTTHYPTTTIYNDESARMVVKYAADTKNYIDQKLATLAAAMVNNL